MRARLRELESERRQAGWRRSRRRRRLSGCYQPGEKPRGSRGGVSGLFGSPAAGSGAL